jgi:glycosyltransferase involved in cell wall biosynthesis
VRVSLVDPSAYTPPYDHALAAALARAGVDVELLTSRFTHGPVPEAEGYRVRELFYRRAARVRPGSRLRAPAKLVEHVPDMRRLRGATRDADLVHLQWLDLPQVDLALLPPTRPRVLTAHDVLPREPHRGQRAAARRLLRAMDAVVVHSEQGARRLREEVGVPGHRVHVIPHGAFDYLTRQPEERPLPAEFAAVDGPVVLLFGLLRPYKGVDVLLEAFRDVSGAELWIVGMPRMDLAPLRELAARARGRVRFVPRFVTDPEIPAFMRRADLVVLPYREIDQSGVLYSALAFGKPLVLSAVGGFVEVAERDGAAELVPPGDPAALAAALEGLLGDPERRTRLGGAAARAAAGPYSWDAIGRRTVELYAELLGRPAPSAGATNAGAAGDRAAGTTASRTVPGTPPGPPSPRP